MSQSRRQSSSAQLFCFTLLGLGAGFLGGYALLGSVDRILHGKERQQLLERRDALKRSRAALEGSGELSSLQTSLLDAGDNIRPVRRYNGAHKTKHGFPATGDTIHTLCTSNGSPYLNYQTRIMHGTYKLVQAMPGGEKLVGFTRILHRTQPDILMDEVPTFRAEPLTPKCDGWCEFPVSDRPNAVAQFFEAAKKDPTMIQAPWLLMLEGDYVWMKPLQAPRAESPVPSWAFPYSYIMPAYPSLEHIMRIMYPESEGPLAAIPGSGPAPVLMRAEEWVKILPDWERLAAHIEMHNQTREKLGWVREMYAFSIATALQSRGNFVGKIKLDLEHPPGSPLMVQPPADHKQGDAALLHYTWGTLVQDARKEKVWVFDKRDYTAPEIERKPPKIPLPPLRKPGWQLHDGSDYDADLANLTTAMLTQMNKAIDRLPELGAARLA